MYIQIKNGPYALIGRKLFEAMGKPSYVHLSRIKGTDTFAIMPMSEEESRSVQCSITTRIKSRKTPARFFWTVPSLEYFKAVTSAEFVSSKIARVKKINLPNGKEIFKICTD